VPILAPIIVIIVGSYLVVAPVVTDPRPEYGYVAGVLFIGFVVYVPFVFYKWSMGCLGNQICFFFSHHYSSNKQQISIQDR
jgi:solute carrier family 7 (L-type amino acid transporter), member 9/15